MKPEMLDDFCETLIAFGDRVRAIVKDVPEGELQAIADEMRERAKPCAGRSFPMPEYERIARLIEAERQQRYWMRRAAEVGADAYCPEHDCDAKECGAMHDD